MSYSETSSSEVKVKYQNSNSEKLIEDKPNEKKPQTTETDYYFGMIANPSKIINKPKARSSESSELDELLKDTESDKSSSSSKKSSSQSSTETSSSTESSTKSNSDSKPKYDQINISPKNTVSETQRVAYSQPKIPTFRPQVSNHQVSNHQVSTASIQSNIPNTADIKPTEPPKPLTQQEIRMKKIELLRKLCEIKAKGYQLSKDYDFNSSLEEMEYEYELLKSFADKRNGVKIFKNGMLQAVSVIEFLNDKYDPFDFHLSGWGEHMSVEVDSWEDVLEEIYEKYKGTGKKMAPEIKLLYLIIASASAFHFSKSQATKLPGLDSVLSSNPGLLSKIMNPGKAESSQFMTPQELNIEKQREELRKKEADSKQKTQQQQMQQQQYIQQLQSQLEKQNEMLQNQQNFINQRPTEPNNKMFGAVLNSNMFGSNEPQASNVKTGTLPLSIPASQLRPVVPDIRAPEQVKDILNRIHNLQPSTIKPSATETQDETSSNNDRLVSETTLSESKKKGRKPKKSNISIF
jgi:hypothetical protein